MFRVKKPILGVLRTVSPMFNDQRLLQTKKVPVFLPFYHLVADRTPDYVKHLYKAKTITEFENELDYILTYFQPIDAKDLIRRVKENDWSGNDKGLMHLTFDDGLTHIHEVVAPILKRKGVPATFFLNTAFLDDKDIFYRYRVSMLWEWIDENRVELSQIKTFRELLRKQGLYREDLRTSLLELTYQHKDLIRNVCKTMLYEKEKEKIYLHTGEVKELIRQGFTIGAHSIDHPIYAMLDPEEQKRQTRESIEEIVKLFDLDYRLFSFPFTDDGVSKDFFDWLHDPKAPVSDLSFGTAGLKSGLIPNHLQRLAMEGDPIPIRKRIKSEYLYYSMLRRVKKQ